MERPVASPPLVRIDEAACIGCTLCIAACPVDAIIGAAKLMHTVLVDRCTGCELCLPPCPVDCIALIPRQAAWTVADAARAQANERARATRLGRRGDRRSEPPSACTDEDALRAQRRAAIAAALARARARRAARRRGARG